MAALGAVTDAGAQVPVHSVTYGEVRPSAQAQGAGLLRAYREATRKEDGNLRCEVLRRIGQPHQLVILEVWRDQAAFEAHGRSAHTAQARSSLALIRNAPIDERVHVAVTAGAGDTGAGGDAVYVVTHVDVIPPRKDDGLAALKDLGAAGRAEAGNLRFEVVQQTNRPNHFTVVELWRDAKAVEAHSMTEATRRFRDALGPMSGALYDERLYTVVE